VIGSYLFISGEEHLLVIREKIISPIIVRNGGADSIVGIYSDFDLGDRNVG
jgi:hypothetical protein